MFLIFSFLISILVTWKLSRLLLNIDSLILWDLHAYFLIILTILSVTQITFLKKISLSHTLIYFLIFLSVIGIVVRFLFYSNFEYVFVVNYLLPIFGFFYGRLLILKKNDFEIEKFFFIIFSIIIILNFLDYLSANNLIYTVFDRSIISDLRNEFGRGYASTFGNADLPILNIIVKRPQGISFSPYASASLILAIAIYFFYNSNYLKKTGLFLGILSLILSLIYAVGTIYLVLLIVVFISLKGVLHRLIYLPIFIFISVNILYFKQVQQIATFLIDMIENIMENSSYLMPLLFTGGGDKAYHLVTGEIYLFNLIFIIGAFGFLILIALIFLAAKNSNKISEDINSNLENIDTNYFMPLFIIFISSIHYNTLFQYPNALVFFFLLGCIDAKVIKGRKSE